jgi:hypothetical protein
MSTGEAEEIVTRSLRRRISVKETSKHERYWDCTIDATGYTLEEQMAELDATMAEAEKRCQQEEIA